MSQQDRLWVRPPSLSTSHSKVLSRQAHLVIIFSLEMAKEQLGQRLLAMQARVEMQKLKQGDLERVDWDRISMAANDLNDTKIVIDDTPGISLMEMRNKCRRLKAEQGLDLVVVDYLQLMKFDGKATAGSRKSVQFQETSNFWQEKWTAR